MTLSLIVAISENGVIGREGDLPWRLSADLRRFKRLTMGHPIIMGRKTFESIGRPLPGRTMIVVTRQPDYRAAGAVVVHSLDEALETASHIDDEVFLIGGAEIYRRALERVDRLYLTRVHADIEGDTRFPHIDFARWRLVQREHHAADEKNEYAHTFKVYERA